MGITNVKTEGRFSFWSLDKKETNEGIDFNFIILKLKK